MYTVRPNLVLGFHGCDKDVRDHLLLNPETILMSRESYGWLGHGMYFWENNHERAMDWALERKRRGAIKTPAVLGAVLHLGQCCDLTDKNSIDMTIRYFARLKNEYNNIGEPLPENRTPSSDIHQDMLIRELDCSVLEFMHGNILASHGFDLLTKGYSNQTIVDSTRGIFLEGGPAYAGAGFFKKSHIQLCIRNANCIKGFFKPRTRIDWP